MTRQPYKFCEDEISNVAEHSLTSSELKFREFKATSERPSLLEGRMDWTTET